MSYLDRIRACQRFEPAEFLPFVVEGEGIGFVRPGFAECLARCRDVFVVTDDRVMLASGLDTPERRTASVRDALRDLAEQGALPALRAESYDVYSPSSGAPLFSIDRVAVPRFGILATGVHLNGIVRTAEGLHMWVGRRSRHKRTAPSRLDQLVAGGRSAGMGVRDTLYKEAEEEASIPLHVIEHAVPVGVVTYCTELGEGLRRDVLFVYDLALPADFVPVNTDEELEDFFLWPIERIMQTVRDTDDYKFNCALVVIDFLVRSGLLPADDPDYVAINEGLRSGVMAGLALSAAR
jgi:8-oxo-dGTP pyrophosphatase MutT (NUDIX family)